MRSILRWSGRIALVLVALLALGATTVYLVTESMLHGGSPTAELQVPPYGDAAVGARLAFVYGCRTCHLPDMRGQVLFQEDFLFRVVAPNVSTALQEYTDADLMRVLRANVRRSGRTAIGMPAPDRHHADRGRRSLQGACGECHGVDLAGGGDMQTPALAVVRAYSLQQFTRLMREGRVLAGTDSAIGLMSGVARARFAHLTDDEIEAMWRYLHGDAE